MTQVQRVPEHAAGIPWIAAWMDRDFGWLEFNRRVLHEARDEQTPLLERLKFLAIFDSNLDEFFMKRVALFRRQALTGPATHPGQQGSPVEKLVEVRRRLLPMLEEEAVCFAEVLVPALDGHGIHLLSWDRLGESQQHQAAQLLPRQQRM